MKKTLKKPLKNPLSLTAETIRVLGNDRLDLVAGGQTSNNSCLEVMTCRMN